MNIEEAVFLTVEEAQEAICLDFEHYGPQPGQLRRVTELLSINHAMPESESAGGVVRSMLALSRPGIDTLVSLCSEVFWTEARPARDDKGKAGILIPTDMDCFHCDRCGKCCLSLDFHRECSFEDVALWRESGRDDILRWVGREADGSFRIWVRPGTDLIAEICPWLTREEDGGWTCSIHDLKPEICREYPGSRKHAFKTGCPTVRGRHAGAA